MWAPDLFVGFANKNKHICWFLSQHLFAQKLPPSKTCLRRSWCRNWVPMEPLVLPFWPKRMRPKSNWKRYEKALEIRPGWGVKVGGFFFIAGKELFFGGNQWLGGGFKHFLFLPLPGEMIQFDEHIFSKGLVQPPTRWDFQGPPNNGTPLW